MLITNCCLLIDDDPFNQAVFTKALNDISPETICFNASNGIDALYMMTEDKIEPSYIFVEMVMPRMNAIEFLRTIKKNNILKEIPVIVHARSPQPHQINELKESGAFAIYYRPFEYFGVRNMLSLYFGPQMANTQPN